MVVVLRWLSAFHYIIREQSARKSIFLYVPIQQQQKITVKQLLYFRVESKSQLLLFKQVLNYTEEAVSKFFRKNQQRKFSYKFVSVSCFKTRILSRSFNFSYKAETTKTLQSSSIYLCKDISKERIEVFFSARFCDGSLWNWLPTGWLAN